MNRILQNIPLSVDPSSKDQPHINRQLTEAIRQLWGRLNILEKNKDIDLTNIDHSELSSIGVLTHVDIDNLFALSQTVVRISHLDSPYIIRAEDRYIECDTDGGAVICNLPKGLQTTMYTILNTGSVLNAVTLNPYGTELLLGANTSQTIYDDDVLDIIWGIDSEGWR
jgi:hypothetical protein